ncbi:putative Amylo-alpha-1,6-glucosidase [Nitrospira moscoviensis]|uniref:Putative Amylo-alpha-1,6-glucosidase n=2 Tax=Nitrospira moscoviensis TaxID=42253 RepID=A0A0K2GE72_NITMO|nr:putative Amylo-alpha-1,6-glucosidase [Nitrospira moscoviensis]
MAWPFALPAAPAALVQAADRSDRRDETLTKGRPTDVESLADAVVVKNENVFFVAQRDGNVPLQNEHGLGLYYHDCRYVNGYELTLAGQQPAHLSASAAQGAVGIFTLTNPRIERPDGAIVDKEEIGITWRRLVDSEIPALRDRLVFRNFTLRAIEFSITLTIRSAFEDLFAVRGLLPKRFGTLHPPSWEGERLRLSYDGKDGVVRALTVHYMQTPERRHGTTAEFLVRMGPRGRHQLDLALVIEESQDGLARRRKPDPADLAALEADLERETQAWMRDVTDVSSNGSSLDQLMERSFRGLRVLRSHLKDETYFAAGVPWFVTLFGRDSLITAWQMLAYHPGVAEQTLRLLAQYQGTQDDPWRDEQPGKILHELRVGEMANIGVIPHTPFYGTVDATPLFLMLIAEHAAWTGSLRLFDALRTHVERALAWMDRYGDRHGEGYLAYVSRAKERLINKGWKDSGDAIVNADGSLAQPPIALVEVQGYAYAAKLGIAGLLERDGDPERAERVRREARRLRERFNRDFWMEDRGCYALALQADGRPAAVISSNPGQALWTGIADTDKAERTIGRLMAEDMFSGWGVRTLSSEERAYNPIGYHLGTVWPHDNSIIAAGCRRYGRDGDALRIFHGLFDAAFHFRTHQLPEVFCGFGRAEYEIPINYPVACHPQAWASGAMPFLLTTLLGLAPDGFGKRLRIVRPLLPDFLDRLELRKLRVGQAAVDLHFQRGAQGVHVDVVKLDGELDVQVEKGS